MHQVKVKAIGGWTVHSEHESYRSAVDQADMVHGKVVVASTGMKDMEAWIHAVNQQGFAGSFDDWQAQDDEERAAYESGADGTGTV